MPGRGSRDALHLRNAAQNAISFSGVHDRVRWEVDVFGRSSKEFEQVRRVAQQDLGLLSGDLLALDPVVNSAGAAPLAVADYRAASAKFELASRSLDEAHTVDDLRHVSAAIDEARYSLACARARIGGEPVPERRAPCFFDPSHGVSLSDVDWTMPDGSTRKVPACGNCAVAVMRGTLPDYRQVDTDEGRVPHWDAPSHHGPYTGGYYDRHGGLGDSLLGGLAGFAAGTLLGDIMNGGGGGGNWN
jgi:hypothetical protein